MLKMYGFTSEELLNAVKKNNVLDVPDIVEVIDTSTGELDNGNKWATLLASPFEELESLRGVGLEERAGHIKISLKGYQGEDIENLIGTKLDTSTFTINFNVSGRFKTIVGAKFDCPDMKALKFID